MFLIHNHVIVWIPEGRNPGILDYRSCWPNGFPEREYIILYDAEMPPHIEAAIEQGYTFVAHNAGGFDREAWARLVGGPQPTWYDTLHCARAGGYPGSLDALGKTFIGRGKDKGKDALRLLYTAKVGRNGETVYPRGTVPLWESVIRYNIADVLLLEKIYEETKDYGEADVLPVHCAINDRGCPVDLQYARNIWDLWHQNESAARSRVVELTQGELTESQVSSVPAVQKWLRRQGVDVPSLNRQSLQQFYEDADDDECPANVALAVQVLRERQSATRATKGKVARVFDVVDDDSRVRNMFRYYGAHTGRWSAGGLQPHNIARGNADLDCEHLLSRSTITLADVARAAANAKCSVDDALVTLFRPIVRTTPGNTLVICDYAQVEARGIAWIAREQALLDIFADSSRDVYCEFASIIFGRTVTKKDKAERQIAKICVLGLGYGMSANKLGSFCRIQCLDLEAAGTSAEQCVKTYRGTYKRIVAVWKELGNAAMRAVRQGNGGIAGRCEFGMDHDALRIELPSGRPLLYRNARIEKRIPGYAVLLGLQMEPRDTVVYDNPHGYSSVLYGGLLGENITQALCRDLLADELVGDDDPLAFCLHVHDEVVAEVDERDAAESLRHVAVNMSRGPQWASGFPIAVEGFTNRCYTKSPFSNSHKVKAMGGKVLC